MAAHLTFQQDACAQVADGAGGAASGSGAPGPERPMAAHLGLIAAYNGGILIALLAAKRAGRLRGRPGAGEILLGALATQRLSRLVTKDRVTAALRAPFTTYQGEGGPGEVEEAPRGRGLRRAIGELLVCPFCIAQWIGAGFACAWLFAPRVTRFVAGLFSLVAVADLLQFRYKREEKEAS